MFQNLLFTFSEDLLRFYLNVFFLSAGFFLFHNLMEGHISQVNPAAHTTVEQSRRGVCLRRLLNIQYWKGLSHEIDFKNVDENGQILALLRAAAGFFNFSEAPLIFCWKKTSVSR